MPGFDEVETSATLLREVRDLRNTLAWAIFDSRYRPRLVDWGRRRGLRHDQAEDVAEMILLKLARALPTFEYDPATGRFRDWLRTVARNQLLDFHRLQGRTPGHEGSGDTRMHEQLLQVSDPASTDELDEGLPANLKEEVALLHHAEVLVKKKVKPENWEACYRMVALEQSATEVAAALGVPRSTVTQARYRVLKQLKEAMRQLLEARG